MKFVLQILASSTLLYFCAQIFPFLDGEGVRMPLDLDILGYIRLYLVGWVLLVILQQAVRPIISFLSGPLKILTFWLFIFVINFAILWLFEWIYTELQFQNLYYHIEWIVTTVFMVAIFTIFHIFYRMFLK